MSPKIAGRICLARIVFQSASHWDVEHYVRITRRITRRGTNKKGIAWLGDGPVLYTEDRPVLAVARWMQLGIHLDQVPRIRPAIRADTAHHNKCDKVWWTGWKESKPWRLFEEADTRGTWTNEMQNSKSVIYSQLSSNFFIDAKR